MESIKYVYGCKFNDDNILIWKKTETNIFRIFKELQDDFDDDTVQRSLILLRGGKYEN